MGWGLSCYEDKDEGGVGRSGQEWAGRDERTGNRACGWEVAKLAQMG